jgi:hypothetical protein
MEVLGRQQQAQQSIEVAIDIVVGLKLQGT